MCALQLDLLRAACHRGAAFSREKPFSPPRNAIVAASVPSPKTAPGDRRGITRAAVVAGAPGEREPPPGWAARLPQW